MHRDRSNVAELEAEVERLRAQTGYVALATGLTPQQKAGRVSGHARRLAAAERRLRAARKAEHDAVA
jgi:hypothetical protein